MDLAIPARIDGDLALHRNPTMHRILSTTALIAGFAAALLAADMAKVGDVMIHEAWVRASLGQAPNSTAYMTLETMGVAPDRLIGAATPVAEKAELHTHIMEGGVARMRPIEAIEVAPGAPTVLAPGGAHIMLMGLNRKLEEGSTIPLTLVFENAGEVTLDVPVQGMGEMGHGGHGSTGHGDPDAPATE